ncbi:MAG: hypothetical protein SFU86_21330 [Pirellulaceae bacterium]|nr:hypothetical protein [Pirellulaceae bacterium]
MSALDDVRNWLGVELPAIVAARDAARQTLDRLRTTQRIEPNDGLPDNLGLVAYGSLAREEWTAGSDIDWTLLNDGSATASHFRLAHSIRELVEQNGYSSPGATGTFGDIASSHELVHRIGGIDDTNQNLTRRVLLLLESVSINDSIVRDRVLRQILERYISFDPSVSWVAKPRWQVPRFLLNDIVRFWRTMAVDYAAKKWQQSGGKWALRNSKLRFSRKLLFVKGLLLCLDSEAGILEPLPSSVPDAQILANQMIERCIRYSNRSALELVCDSVRRLGNSDVASQLLLSYDQFLSFMNNEDIRKDLESLRFDEAHQNSTFTKIRRISMDFQRGLELLFFAPNSPWSKLMMDYGVF